VRRLKNGDPAGPTALFLDAGSQDKSRGAISKRRRNES